MADPTDPVTPSEAAPAGDAPLVVATFLARYLADQEAAGPRSLEVYQAMFPGHEARIAAEFVRLQDGERPLDDVVGERIAGFRILGELGRGGQGIVYLARDDRLQRQVALKVLPGAFAAAVARQRLLREAQAASRLDDPGICTVYDAGETAGVAWIAMRHVDGESLSQQIAREREQAIDRAAPSRLQTLLRQFAAIARSLHAAHEKGLVHRDLKPSNLMLEKDGTPVVLDFGLAHFDDHPDGTLTGEQVLGTPAYMSPEQLQAQQGRVDRRSDVFSLAVTFYESLLLQHPFAAPTQQRLLQQILADDPLPPSRVLRGLPKDLDVVLGCALNKERERRYATMAEFASDLLAIAERRPIAARRPGALRRSWLWARRHPVAAGIATTVASALLLVAALTTVHARELDGALQRERAARARSDGLRLASAADSVRAQDAELAALLAEQAIARHDDSQTRGALLGALTALRMRPAVDAVADAKWVRLSGDGRQLAVGSKDEVALVDVATRRLRCSVPCPDAEHAELFWAHDGSHFALAIDNNIFRIGANGLDESRAALWLCRGDDGQRIAVLPIGHGKVTNVAFAADSPHLLAATAPRDPEGMGGGGPQRHPGAVAVFAIADGALLWRSGELARGALDADFTGIRRGDACADVDVLTGGGSYLRLRGQDGSVGTERHVFDPDKKPAATAALLNHGVVAVATLDDVALWAGRGDDEPQRAPTHGGELVLCGNREILVRVVHRPARIELPLQDGRFLTTPPRDLVAVGRNRRTVASGQFAAVHVTNTITANTVQAVFSDGSVRNWRVDTGEFFDLPPVGGDVVAAHMSTEGAVIATVGTDGTVRVFAPDAPPVLASLRGLDPAAWFALHPRGDVAVAFANGKAQLVDLATGAVRWELDRGDDWRIAVFAPDGGHIAIGDDNGAVAVLRLDGTVECEVAANEHGVTGFTFTRDGSQLAIARGDLTVIAVATGATTLHLAPTAPVATASFAADDSLLLLGGIGGNRWFTFPNGTPADGLQSGPAAHPGFPSPAVGNAALLLDELAVPQHQIGGNGRARLLSLPDGAVRDLGVEAATATGGALSPDGRLAVIARADGQLLQLDLQTGTERLLPAHDRGVRSVRWAADGSCFASGQAAHDFPNAHDERAVVVHARNGDQLLRVDGTDGVRWFELDAAGQWLVVASGDGELRRYPVRPLAALRQLGLRQLTARERTRYAIDADGATPR